MNKKLKIAVVGIGDVFKRFYFTEDVLCKIAKRHSEYEIYCADKTKGWDKDDKRENLINHLTHPFYFVDVSNQHPSRVNKEKSFGEWLKKIKFDLIVIATPDFAHIEAALEWIPAEFRTMIIEKPFSNDPKKVDELLVNSGYKDDKGRPKVEAFSHFRAKIHEQFKDANSFINTLGEKFGRLKKFRFFGLEDYSGTDLDYINEFINKEIKRGNAVYPNENGPIEIPGREKALTKGMVYDLGSHMLSILHYFGDPKTLDPKKIWAGQYIGVGNDYRKKTKIDGETFAKIDFSFIDYSKNEVKGQVYIGKGIRGIDNPNKFGLCLDKSELGEVKLLELEGEYGDKIQIFFKRRRKGDKKKLKRVIFPDKKIQEVEFSIEKNPYLYIFQKALDPIVLDEESLFFDAQVAQSFLVKIKDIKDKIDEGVKSRKGRFPKYKLGKKLSNGKIIPCESLDEIMDRFEPIWEKSKS